MASLLAKVQAFLQRPMGRYVLVGGSVYVVELAAIVILQAMGIPALWAVAASFWIGLVLSFTLQKLFTFGDRRLSARVAVPQAAAFTALVLFNFGFTLLATRLLTPPLPAMLVRTIALGVTTIWNFYLYKTRIFQSSATLVVD